jgi:hypothetical protein
LSPAAINPATGVVTLIKPNFGYNLNYPGGPTDVVSLANALYITTDFPGDLLAIDETTGAQTFLETKLNGKVVPVADMTVNPASGLKLPRFRGQRTICVRGVHDVEEQRSLSA